MMNEKEQLEQGKKFIGETLEEMERDLASIFVEIKKCSMGLIGSFGPTIIHYENALKAIAAKRCACCSDIANGSLANAGKVV